VKKVNIEVAEAATEEAVVAEVETEVATEETTKVNTKVNTKKKVNKEKVDIEAEVASEVAEVELNIDQRLLQLRVEKKPHKSKVENSEKRETTATELRDTAIKESPEKKLTHTIDKTALAELEEPQRELVTTNNLFTRRKVIQIQKPSFNKRVPLRRDPKESRDTQERIDNTQEKVVIQEKVIIQEKVVIQERVVTPREVVIDAKEKEDQEINIQRVKRTRKKVPRLK
jgi:hypothetical protein